ncbi:MAG: hypothetical protein U0X91_31030 [Spirosomataceae bacterium]
MKTAIIGSRNITDCDLTQALDGLIVTEIISGGAMGVDRLAEEFAKKHQLRITIFLIRNKGRTAAQPTNRRSQ